MDGRMRCRVGRLRFAHSEQPDPAERLTEACIDLTDQGRCNCWVYPGKVGAARLAMTAEDVALNRGDDPKAFDDDGFFCGVCDKHAVAMFEIVVEDRACRSPLCAPVSGTPRARPRLARVMFGDEPWCCECAEHFGWPQGIDVKPDGIPDARAPALMRLSEATVGAEDTPSSDVELSRRTDVVEDDEDLDDENELFSHLAVEDGLDEDNDETTAGLQTNTR